MFCYPSFDDALLMFFDNNNLALDTSSVEAIDTEFEDTFCYEKSNFSFCFEEINTQGTNVKIKPNRFVDFHNN